MSNTTEQTIYVLAGPVHSGKTTRLMQRLDELKNVYGILTPVMDGRRFFVNAATKEIFPMEASRDDVDVMEVGRFIFSTAAFNKANAVLNEAAGQLSGWLVIDEIGPLELTGKGFHDALEMILKKTAADMKIILVIREGLVDEVLRHFHITNYFPFE